MAQALVAQAQRQHHLAGKHRYPEFDVGPIAAEMPNVIVALGDSAFDGMLQIDPAKRMPPSHARNYPVIQALARAAAGNQADVCRERRPALVELDGGLTRCARAEELFGQLKVALHA